MAKFVLKKEHTFSWPVKIKAPSSTGVGQFETQQIDVRFRAITRAESDAEAAAYDALTSDAERIEYQDATLRRSVVGWDQRTVLDEEGEEIPFSESALDQALEMPWVRLAFYEAYARAISGEAKKGN